MLSRRQALGLSILGMLVTLASAIAGMLVWEHGEELERVNEDAFFYTEGLEYMCCALCGAPPLVMLGVALVITAAASAPQPPDPPTSF